MKLEICSRMDGAEVADFLIIDGREVARFIAGDIPMIRREIELIAEHEDCEYSEDDIDSAKSEAIGDFIDEVRDFIDKELSEAAAQLVHDFLDKYE